MKVSRGMTAYVSPPEFSNSWKKGIRTVVKKKKRKKDGHPFLLHGPVKNRIRLQDLIEPNLKYTVYSTHDKRKTTIM